MAGLSCAAAGRQTPLPAKVAIASHAARSRARGAQRNGSAAIGQCLPGTTPHNPGRTGPIMKQR